MIDNIKSTPIQSGIKPEINVKKEKKEEAAVPAGDKFEKEEPKEKRGLVLMQIDGLSHNALKAAIKGGHAPNIAKLMSQKDYVLSPFQCGIATVTIPVLASIFYGVELPGNDWYDKKSGELIDGIMYETKLREDLAKQGKEGIMAKGVTFSSPLSGGSFDTAMTVNPLKEGKNKDGLLKTLVKEAKKDIHLLKKGGYSLTKTAWHFIKDIFTVSSWMKSEGVRRTKLDKAAAILMSLNHNVIEKVAAEGMIEAMEKGVPIMYTDFAAYDEKAHYFGGRSKKAMEVLETVDAQIGKVVDAAEKSKEKYEVLVFSDHGQTPSKLFADLYGKPVGDMIKDFAGHVAQSRGETLKEDAIVFTDAYSLGNVYFNFDKGKVNMDQIEKHHPQMADFLTDHPGIGLVCGRQDGGLVMQSPEGKLVQDKEGKVTITGKNPLTAYGDEKVIINQVSNYMKLDGSGDLVIFGAYDKDADEVIDFNQKYSLKSLHGGLGGDQTKPFIIRKPDVPVQGDEITEATQLHDLHDKYKDYLKGY